MFFLDLYTVPEEKRKNLAEVLRKARENKNLGLNQLAVKTGIQSSIISRLENGKILKINPYLLKKIAEGLGIDYKELYKIVGYLEENNYTFDNEGEIYFDEFLETDTLINRSHELIEHLKKSIKSNEDFIKDLQEMESSPTSSEVAETHQRQIESCKSSIKNIEKQIKNEEYILNLYIKIRKLQGIALHGQKFYKDNINKINKLEISNDKKD